MSQGTLFNGCKRSKTVHRDTVTFGCHGSMSRLGLKPSAATVTQHRFTPFRG